MSARVRIEFLPEVKALVAGAEKAFAQVERQVNHAAEVQAKAARQAAAVRERAERQATVRTMAARRQADKQLELTQKQAQKAAARLQEIQEKKLLQMRKQYRAKDEKEEIAQARRLTDRIAAMQEKRVKITSAEKVAANNKAVKAILRQEKNRVDQELQLLKKVAYENKQIARHGAGAKVGILGIGRNIEQIAQQRLRMVAGPMADIIPISGKAAMAMGGAAMAGAGLGMAMSKVINVGSNFDQQMTKSIAIMKNVDDTMRTRMEKTAREVATSLGISHAEAAESYFYLASAGLDAKQSIAALPQVAKFAKAGMFDMARATDLATDAQSALKLTVKDAEQNLANLTRVTDVFVKANTLANATVEQFSISMTNKGAVGLNQVNKGLEEGTAILAAYADQGIKAEKAGEMMYMMLRDLGTAAYKFRDQWNALGITVYDANGAIRNTADIIADLEKALGPMSVEQRKAALMMLGMKDRSQAATLALLGTSEKIREYERELRKAGGTTDEVANKQMQSFAEKSKVMINRLKDIAIEIFDRTEPALSDMVDSAAALATQLGGTVVAISRMIDKLRDMGGPLVKAIGLFRTFQIAATNAMPFMGSAYVQGVMGRVEQKKRQRFLDGITNIPSAIDATTGQVFDPKNIIGGITDVTTPRKSFSLFDYAANRTPANPFGEPTADSGGASGAGGGASGGGRGGGRSGRKVDPFKKALEEEKAVVLAYNTSLLRMLNNREISEQEYRRRTLANERILADRKLAIARQFAAEGNKEAEEDLLELEHERESSVQKYREHLEKMRTEREDADRKSMEAAFRDLDLIAKYANDTTAIIKSAADTRAAIFGAPAAAGDIASEFGIDPMVFRTEAGPAIIEAYRELLDKRATLDVAMAEELAAAEEQVAIVGTEAVEARKREIRRKYQAQKMADDKAFAESSAEMEATALEGLVAQVEKYKELVGWAVELFRVEAELDSKRQKYYDRELERLRGTRERQLPLAKTRQQRTEIEERSAQREQQLLEEQERERQEVARRERLRMIAQKAGELALWMFTEQMKTVETEKGVLIRAALAAEDVVNSLKSAAGSVLKAIGEVIASVASMGWWALPIAAGGIATIYGMYRGAKSLLGFEKGGLIPAGERVIRVNEDGQEMVMNAGAVSRYGPLLEEFNAGAMDKPSLGRALVNNLSASGTGLPIGTTHYEGVPIWETDEGVSLGQFTAGGSKPLLGRALVNAFRNPLLGEGLHPPGRYLTSSRHFPYELHKAVDPSKPLLGRALVNSFAAPFRSSGNGASGSDGSAEIIRELQLLREGQGIVLDNEGRRLSAARHSRYRSYARL